MFLFYIVEIWSLIRSAVAATMFCQRWNRNGNWPRMSETFADLKWFLNNSTYKAHRKCRVGVKEASRFPYVCSSGIGGLILRTAERSSALNL